MSGRDRAELIVDAVKDLQVRLRQEGRGPPAVGLLLDCVSLLSCNFINSHWFSWLISFNAPYGGSGFFRRVVLLVRSGGASSATRSRSSPTLRM